MLKDYITEDLIAVKVPADDWQSAIQACGDLMQRNGLCEPSYTSAMIDAVKRLGPYMVLAPGIALAHARPEDGMLKMGLAIVTLANGVDFGSTENDPVFLIIGFGGIDHHSHIEMLQSLAVFLSEEENQQALRNALTVTDVLHILHKSGA